MGKEKRDKGEKNNNNKIKKYLMVRYLWWNWTMGLRLGPKLELLGLGSMLLAHGFERGYGFPLKGMVIMENDNNNRNNRNWVWVWVLTENLGMNTLSNESGP